MIYYRKALILFAFLIVVVASISGCITENYTTDEGQATSTPPNTSASPEYEPTAIAKNIGVDGFSITLLTAGRYVCPLFSTVGPENEFLRIDLKVENTLEDAKSIYPNITSNIIVNGERHPAFVVASQASLGGMYEAGEVRRGYVLFDGSVSEGDRCTFVIEVPSTPPKKAQIEFVFDNQ